MFLALFVPGFCCCLCSVGGGQSVVMLAYVLSELFD